MLALTLAFVAVLHLTGLRADRALTKPGEHPPSLTSLGVDLASPGSVSGSLSVREAGWRDKPFGATPSPASPTARYRNLTAYQWAMKYKRRTSDYHKARSSIRAIVLGGYGNDWLERAFLCIHSYEGSWTDPNAPFYGGLQMDLDFQHHYGSWALKAFGTADRWPVSVQISTAIQAYKAGRGFYPWPNTARNCGLI